MKFLRFLATCTIAPSSLSRHSVRPCPTGSRNGRTLCQSNFEILSCPLLVPLTVADRDMHVFFKGGGGGVGIWKRPCGDVLQMGQFYHIILLVVLDWVETCHDCFVFRRGFSLVFLCFFSPEHTTVSLTIYSGTMCILTAMLSLRKPFEG